MRVTVVPVDKVIIVDGNGITLEDWNFDDNHIHAIQWMHNHGHIELKTNDPNIEISDISEIQKYIDVYMNEIPGMEEKILKEQEETRLRMEREEQERIADEEERKQKEKEIQDLIDQNRKIREDKMKLEEDHSNALIQKSLIEERNRLELDRIAFEKQSEIETLKHGETLKEIMKRDNELMERYEGLMSQLDEQRDAFKGEQESAYKIIALKEEQIEAEKEELSKRRELFQLEMETERKKLDNELERIHAEKLNYDNEIDYNRDLVKVFAETIELETERLKQEKELQKEEIEEQNKHLNKLSEQYDAMNDQLTLTLRELHDEKQRLEVEIKRREDELDQEISQSQKLTELSIAREIELQYIDNIEKQNSTTIQELESSTNFEDVSVERLQEIINDLDPEEVYTSLTSGEIDENNFPVEKAIIWFSALKKVMDERN